MDKPKSKQMLIILGVAIIVFLFLFLSGNKAVGGVVNKVADAIGLPNVKGFDLNIGDATYNIPGLKYRKGCGQLACQSNVIPQSPNSMGLANPKAGLSNMLGAQESVASMARNDEMILVHLAPAFYPFGVDRMVGGIS